MLKCVEPKGTNKLRPNVTTVPFGTNYRQTNKHQNETL
jgi:hypothetical protein